MTVEELQHMLDQYPPNLKVAINTRNCLKEMTTYDWCIEKMTTYNGWVSNPALNMTDKHMIKETTYLTLRPSEGR